MTLLFNIDESKRRYLGFRNGRVESGYVAMTSQSEVDIATSIDTVWCAIGVIDNSVGSAPAGRVSDCKVTFTFGAAKTGGLHYTIIGV